MAERLGNRAINQKVVGLIPGRAKLRILGQGTSPYLPRGECPNANANVRPLSGRGAIFNVQFGSPSHLFADPGV